MYVTNIYSGDWAGTKQKLANAHSRLKHTIYFVKGFQLFADDTHKKFVLAQNNT